MDLTFLGAAGTVTGSKYLLQHQGRQYLIDCGLYQGVKNLRQRNWQPLPLASGKLDAVLLTHAHIDHSGYLPALVRRGYMGPVYSSKATFELCKILLPDAGYLQEEDARYANKRKFSRHSPAEPLFTVEDAERALKLFRPVDFDEPLELGKGLNARFSPVGHIIGASCIHFRDARASVLFSGDVGRQDDPVMYPPQAVSGADYLVVESTYGNRRHGTQDPKETLETIINETAGRGGIVLIPSFAVGRAQLLLHLICELKREERILELPLYLNSPMAISATELHKRFHKLHRLSHEQCEQIDACTHYVRSVEESIELNSRKMPAIIISASGMASGGRVLHHLKALISNHRNSVVFAGFQAPGTRGDALLNGAEQVKIHGEQFPVKAQIHSLDNLSAHGDHREIIEWLRQFKAAPRHTWITHGEPAAADAMRVHVREALGWAVSVAEYRDLVRLE
ncbi:MBL fold metallo-hydrolase RNA specificity domain-containing protein [Aestuariirhabdus litorea]|uniref:MBL fold metallo-hydrolase n=1 Tax=Aestuariirhabdus litorea TaxID=2528527 RepID=A0A3P3VLE7_9GAMM|nr:MBL fold metallo-hydrolase [Aestuariirhabdus litorea]RRJ83234.1 MBL fold metallo-hydrolase [Aestuariirhabdus litorea]RWW93391.1 MBL fold metallo-hydrolase [Endozoicomonadaceae bacterium GTF-13]